MNRPGRGSGRGRRKGVGSFGFANVRFEHTFETGRVESVPKSVERGPEDFVSDRSVPELESIR